MTTTILRGDRLQSVLSRLTEHENGCWEWTGARDQHGYGRVGYGPRRLGIGLVHRLVYEALVSVIPTDLELDHLCRNPSCANPKHLEPVTHAENVRRGLAPELLASRNASVTHCPRGHAYDDTNTYQRADKPSRDCRTCRREATRRWRARRSA